MKIECKICNLEFNIKGFSSHISKHGLKLKDYYDIYLKREDEGICVVCGNSTKFRGFSLGYLRSCSNKCSQLMDSTKEKKKNTCLNKFNCENPFQSDVVKNKIRETVEQRYNVKNVLQIEEIRKKTLKSMQSNKVKSKIRNTFLDNIRKFELENNCTWLNTLVKEYGKGILGLDLKKLSLHKHAVFILNKDLIKIQNWFKSVQSSKEFLITRDIKSYYDGKVLSNIKNIISPLELDIYLPRLKLAIEYNGIYWHSNKEPNYHLNKSLLCRKKGIRLIHIYEFEDFNNQLNLLKQLILGNDLYPENDFNKNNLIDEIPEPEVIFSKDEMVIYGAGKLF